MINATQIAGGIYRLSLWDEEDLVKAGIFFPSVSYNMFLIKAQQPTIIETMYRRSFQRLLTLVGQMVDPQDIRYLVIPHHEGDSSGAINEWLKAAPRAQPLCSELCAALSLRDFSEREPRVVSDEEVLDLGTHRLRFLLTPRVNQWDSLMIYEETTGTLFPNDLFSSMGTEITVASDHSAVALRSARELGYQADDRVSLDEALDKIEPLDVKVIANMHGPTVTAHIRELFRTFRENRLSS